MEEAVPSLLVRLNLFKGGISSLIHNAKMVILTSRMKS